MQARKSIKEREDEMIKAKLEERESGKRSYSARNQGGVKAKDNKILVVLNSFIPPEEGETSEEIAYQAQNTRLRRAIASYSKRKSPTYGQ